MHLYVMQASGHEPRTDPDSDEPASSLMYASTELVRLRLLDWMQETVLL